MGTPIGSTLQRGGGGTAPFPVTVQEDIRIGYVIKTDINARNAIPEWARTPYMKCFVISDQTEYRLGVDTTIAGQNWTPQGGPFQTLSEKNQPGGYVGLDVDGYINPVYIKAIYAQDYFTAADETERFGLTTTTGDLCRQLDNNHVYIKTNNNAAPTIASDWADITTSVSITSVNGDTGPDIVIDIVGLLAYGSNQSEFNTAVGNAPSVGALNASVAQNTTDIQDLVIAVTALQNKTSVNLPIYSASTQYLVGNCVLYDTGTGDKSLFRCHTQPPIGTSPTNISYWELIAGGGSSGTTTYQKTKIWTWSEGVPGVGDTYIDFVLDTATQDNEIGPVGSCLLWVNGFIQTNNFSVVSTNYQNDTIRITASSGDELGTTEVVLSYNRVGVGGVSSALEVSYDDSAETGGNLPTSAPELQTAVEQVRDWANEPVQQLTTFDDSGTITIDGTKEYSTTRTVTGANHTLTFATTENKRGNYYLVVYTFDQDCVLTLTNLNTTFSTLGQTDPIAAGTYPLWMFVNPQGTISLVIQNNSGTTPTTLTTPTLALSVGNGQLGYTITGIDTNATGGTLDYSTDNVNWTNWASYSFGTETGNITGLTNGVLYYVRYRNTASGYNPSGYATDTATPSSGLIQLDQITTFVISKTGTNGFVFTWDATSGNEDSISLEQSDNGTSGWSVVSSIAAGLTTTKITNLANATQKYYRIRELGDGITYSNGPYSATTNGTTDTPLTDDFDGVTIDTGKWTVTNPNSTDIIIDQNDQLQFRQLTTGTTSTPLADYVNSIKTFHSDFSLYAKFYIDRTVSNSQNSHIVLLNKVGDATTRIYVTKDSGSGSINARLLVDVSGVNVYDSGNTGIAFDNNTFRVVVNQLKQVALQYHNGTSWTSIATSSIDIFPDAELYMQITGNAYNGSAVGTNAYFDNLDIRNEGYSGLTP